MGIRERNVCTDIIVQMLKQRKKAQKAKLSSSVSLNTLFPYLKCKILKPQSVTVSALNPRSTESKRLQNLEINKTVYFSHDI